MRLYSGTTKSLIEDSTCNRISYKLKDAFFSEFRYQPSVGEVNSWNNSLRAVSQVFQAASLLDHGVLLELQLPLTSKRLDCLVTGYDHKKGGPNAVIIELKQWSGCKGASGKNEVATFVGGNVRDVLHPSVQVGQYMMYMTDCHTAFQGENGISAHACSYLHNYSATKDDPLFVPQFKEQVDRFPVFTADHVSELTAFLDERIHGSDGGSIIAMNLLGDLSEAGLNAHYVTGSRAFTSTIREIVGNRGAAQVRYFNSYMGSDVDVIDVMIADEAHRIRETSNNRFTPKVKQSKLPQIQELLKASRTSVFFIDDNQIVRPGEIGSTAYIKAEAEKLQYEVSEFELEAQFRCAGSDAFVSWVNNTLGVQRTPHVMWNQADEFDFRIMPTPQALENAIRKRLEEKSTARLAAGCCWPWSNPRSNGTLVDDVVIGDYVRPWNAKSDSGSLAPGIPKESLWAYDSGGVDQIGCVYTAQGFEFDYVGVIFGPDLVYVPEAADWKGDKTKSFDTVVKKSGDRFTQMVKNTYRVLLTRGMKGCYVHFMDKNTENLFRSRVEHTGKV